jgi:hypothetical protein
MHTCSIDKVSPSHRHRQPQDKARHVPLDHGPQSEEDLFRYRARDLGLDCRVSLDVGLQKGGLFRLGLFCRHLLLQYLRLDNIVKAAISVCERYDLCSIFGIFIGGRKLLLRRRLQYLHQQKIMIVAFFAIW